MPVDSWAPAEATSIVEHPIRPDAVESVRLLARHQVPMAIVSGAQRERLSAAVAGPALPRLSGGRA